MRTLRFGRTGVTVPAVSLGTWAYGGPNTAGDRSVGWSGHDDDKALGALRAAHAAGITHWDTADVYGNGRSETLIGKVWDDVPRDEIFLATKVGWDQGGFDRPYHPELMRKHVERSLTNLRTDVIDLYYLHHSNFGDDLRYLDEATETVRRFQSEGKVRFVGLSDWFSEKIMKAIATVDPDAVQPYRNVLNDTYASSGLKAWVEEHDVGVAFFSPIRHGLLLGKYDAPTTFPEGDFRSGVDAFTDAALITKLKERADRLRERFGDSAQPVLAPLLGAILADCPTGCALLGQRDPDQVAAAAGASAALSADDAAWVLEQYADLA